MILASSSSAAFKKYYVKLTHLVFGFRESIFENSYLLSFVDFIGCVLGVFGIFVFGRGIIHIFGRNVGLVIFGFNFILESSPVMRSASILLIDGLDSTENMKISFVNVTKCEFTENLNFYEIISERVQRWFLITNDHVSLSFCHHNL